MNSRNVNLGISGLAVYMPPYRVQLQQWCDWTGTSWPKIEAVVGRSFRISAPDESVYTMAATAVLRLIRQYDIDPAEVGFLGLGTESSTDNSAGPIIIKGMLDAALPSLGLNKISRSCEVPEFKHACLGGVYAMKGALRYLALDGRGKKAIVVCADIAEYERGSSGEPTQGAGAVAMLLETDAKLVSVPLELSGSASDYRAVDFRKPMLRFCGQDSDSNTRIQDFPVFNGKYSTTCYIDETLRALEDMYEKRRVNSANYLRSLNYVFMHRPYRRMPETALAYAYLNSLASNPVEGHDELASYARDAGIPLDSVVRELTGTPDVATFASEASINSEPFPLAAAVLHIFRGAPAYQTEVLQKLSLGAESSCEFGNLYTAALPAWLAAGFEIAIEENIELAGEEILTMGYGSGDAAEIIPFNVVDNWQDAASRICFSESMVDAVDLNQGQYEALHDRRPVTDLPLRCNSDFTIAAVGNCNDRHFQDIGIEYYQFAGSTKLANSA